MTRHSPRPSANPSQKHSHARRTSLPQGISDGSGGGRDASCPADCRCNNRQYRLFSLLPLLPLHPRDIVDPARPLQGTCVHILSPPSSLSPPFLGSPLSAHPFLGLHSQSSLSWAFLSALPFWGLSLSPPFSASSLSPPFSSFSLPPFWPHSLPTLSWPFLTHLFASSSAHPFWASSSAHLFGLPLSAHPFFSLSAHPSWASSLSPPFSPSPSATSPFIYHFSFPPHPSIDPTLSPHCPPLHPSLSTLSALSSPSPSCPPFLHPSLSTQPTISLLPLSAPPPSLPVPLPLPPPPLFPYLPLSALLFTLPSQPTLVLPSFSYPPPPLPSLLPFSFLRWKYERGFNVDEANIFHEAQDQPTHSSTTPARRPFLSEIPLAIIECRGPSTVTDCWRIYVNVCISCLGGGAAGCCMDVASEEEGVRQRQDCITTTDVIGQGEDTCKRTDGPRLQLKCPNRYHSFPNPTQTPHTPPPSLSLFSMLILSHSGHSLPPYPTPIIPKPPIYIPP
ncbi:hypothetical protein C7M84_023266 [Penaeus vannamei]|uniref:Uncharacterized protein n=1 Tax=Penaeus vannamei TaxID=6689 RepID=A0A423U4D8_PENVA|nr:hypothetical protein C7M84_023266 [Penaeus vannamei]